MVALVLSWMWTCWRGCGWALGIFRWALGGFRWALGRFRWALSVFGVFGGATSLSGWWWCHIVVVVRWLTHCGAPVLVVIDVMQHGVVVVAGQRGRGFVVAGQHDRCGQWWRWVMSMVGSDGGSRKKSGRVWNRGGTDKTLELLEHAKPKWEEMIQVLKARLPCTQDFQRGQSTSPPTDAGPHLPGAADVIHMVPTVTDAAPHSPGAAHGTDMAPTIAPSTPAPASNAPLQLQSPITAKQQSVVATTTAGVAPAAPSSPTAPNTEGVELVPVEVSPGSPLTAIGSRPTSLQSGDERNTSTGCKRKADEEVDADITRKKLASNQKKGPPSAPQRRQPAHGKAPNSVNPVTAGQLSKLDTIIEEDL
ncbi:uncharacterized protein LACBIDRAFT_327923 [Laccaria bicolor S238N-H82]|uniref:Predicted protein n=1 Tax=Laccaria bicolor (strain S238N-H82 / ATCC MYA-4686) TaxID=486041 RepID=B0DD85_LACBS|nr:uncharacterized protein LACBIDRAFT_327923 [Laccaria bicolor S238N-H82]EDR07563.1 predicted protein [Laccaria bicolor S238N-H82]|eukprot:XP_001881955.1 predicted protein [Laccaria bicolor S238N-H82]